MRDRGLVRVMRLRPEALPERGVVFFDAACVAAFLRGFFDCADAVVVKPTAIRNITSARQAGVKREVQATSLDL